MGMHSQVNSKCKIYGCAEEDLGPVPLPRIQPAGMRRCQGYTGARVTQVPGLHRCQGYTGARVTQVPGLHRCQGYTGARVTQVPGIMNRPHVSPFFLLQEASIWRPLQNVIPLREIWQAPFATFLALFLCANANIQLSC